MKITCISASNVKKTGRNSASTTACMIVKDIINEKYGMNIEVNIIPLMEYELKPCEMCGKCSGSYECSKDSAFNEIFSQIVDSDGLFVICPHYAPVPSKLMMIMEKLEEFAFLHYCTKGQDGFLLSGKPAAVIGHGGQAKEFEECYKKALLEPIANALSSTGMEIVGINEEWANGVVFGIKGMRRVENSILPEMEHDWKEIAGRIEPLVDRLMEKLR